MRTIVIFGCSQFGKKAFQFFGSDMVFGFVDNNPKFTGKKLFGKEILSFQQYLDLEKSYPIVIAAGKASSDAIAGQLENAGVHCYLLFYLLNDMDKRSPDEVVETLYHVHPYAELQKEYYLREIRSLQRKMDYLIANCDAGKLKKATGFLRKKQLTTLAFTAQFLSRLDGLNLHPFLDRGDLLGLVRNKGFIPWDDDVDICFMRADYERFLAYCKDNFYTITYDGTEFGEKYYAWLNQRIREHPGEYIIVYEYNGAIVQRGTSIIDRVSFDVFSYDYFDDDYDFSLYNQKIEQVKSIINHSDSKLGAYKKVIDIMKKEREAGHIVDASNTLYFSLDNMFISLNKNTKWILRDVIFPLKKAKFEGIEFNIPNKPEVLLTYHYGNYEVFPGNYDFGVPSHILVSNCCRKILKTIDLYVRSADDVDLMMPIYTNMRIGGVFAIFVIDENEIPSNSRQYADLVKELDAQEAEYTTICNLRADVVVYADGEKLPANYSDATKKIAGNTTSELLAQCP